MEYADGGDLQVIILIFSTKSSKDRTVIPVLDSSKNLSGKLHTNFYRDSEPSTKIILFTGILKVLISFLQRELPN